MIYDKFQLQAIEHIKKNKSVIVSAPTGSGKTAIAEYIINDSLKKGKKIIYTSPIKALSNQKYRDFQEKFKNKIGILTGDVNINPNAPVLIMTTEIFRNKILVDSNNLDEYFWIIFDEIHYIDNYERGTVWEESLIFLPKHMNILALSATIPNIDEFANWIYSIHKKPLITVKEENRPVPLHFLFQCENNILDNIKDIKKSYYKNQIFNIKKKRKIYKQPKINKLNTLLNTLIEKDHLPCIYFAFGRKKCEILAEKIQTFNLLKEKDKKKITKLYKNLYKKYNLINEKSAIKMIPFITNGIAYHHAGMLPTLKEVIEQLFISGLIKIIFTTETFALGINMPVRTVVFDELRKFYGRFFSNLKTRDFYQMAGRAGRRNLDKEGFVYSRINLEYLPPNELNRIINNTPETVKSRFNASYATILNLYERYNEKLYQIYPFSFHAFQEKKKNQKKAIELLHRKVNILKHLGYIKNNKLTEKGNFASKIYGYELPLTELYKKGILEKLSIIDLATIITALVFEPRKPIHSITLTKETKTLHNATKKIIKTIHEVELNFKLKDLSKNYYYDLSSCIRKWIQQKNFYEILENSYIDEGTIIRYFRMTIQILRELLETPTSLEFKKTIKETIFLINRDIINAENQLRS